MCPSSINLGPDTSYQVIMIQEKNIVFATIHKKFTVAIKVQNKESILVHQQSFRLIKFLMEFNHPTCFVNKDIGLKISSSLHLTIQSR